MSPSAFGAAVLCASLLAGTVPAVGTEEPTNSPATTLTSDPTEPTAEEIEPAELNETNPNTSEGGNVVIPEEGEIDNPDISLPDTAGTEDTFQSKTESQRSEAHNGLESVAPLSASTQALSTWSDNFSRTVSKGWGNTYTLDGSSPSAAFSVNGKLAQVQVPADHTGVANTVGFAGRDVNAKVTVQVSAVPTSGYGTFSSLNLRVSNESFYRATLRLAPDKVAAIKIERVGTSSTTLVQDIKLPFAPKANTDYNFEFQTTGTSKVELAARRGLSARTRRHGRQRPRTHQERESQMAVEQQSAHMSTAMDQRSFSAMTTSS